jgi:hypothetical protein
MASATALPKNDPTRQSDFLGSLAETSSLDRFGVDMQAGQALPGAEWTHTTHPGKAPLQPGEGILLRYSRRESTIYFPHFVA